MVASLALIAALGGFDLREFERPRAVAAAEAALASEPRAITSALNPRSAGGPHDFSSEGDYWWSDPANPAGPYIRRDGLTNPDNFTAHRDLMFGMARDVGALAAAWDLTRDERFAAAAVRHLRAWFVDDATRMNPNLRYAQSIQGITDGRGIGIIDTLHLAEVALAVEALRGSAALDAPTDAAITGWFREYLHWIRTHPNGIEESRAKNNHGTCWVLQAAAFARLTGDPEALAMCRARLVDDLLPNQMAPDGSFPLEMARTKPYGYAIFNLDVMTALAAVLSTPEDNLLAFALPDGRGLVRGVEFLAPFLADKSKWPLPPDVMYWDDWPIRQPALLFGAIGAGRKDWLELWKSLPADSPVAEVQRNFPVRYPTLWLRLLQRGSAKAAAAREVINFNPDWRFVKADPAGAQAVDFDDSAWERVSTPHTFNDTDTFDNWSLPGHKGEQEQWSGRTWYRKHFDAPARWSGRRVFIEFESVRQIAEVFLNGERLGAHKTGFTPFGFDLTPHLRAGARNVLAVMVDNRFQKDPSDYSPAGTGATGGKTKTLAQIVAEHNEAIPERIDDLAADLIPWNNPHWHPAHGGIYRDVRLVVTDPLHITLPLYSFLETAGPYAYALELSDEVARIGVEVPIVNGRDATQKIEVHVEMSDASGKRVGSTSAAVDLAAGARQTVKLEDSVEQPRLWSPEDPHAYTIECSIVADGEVVDSTEIPLGMRHARWDPAAGLFHNGRHLKLHGWGQKSTNEWPGLGAAQPAWLHEFTLALMRDAGGNMVRWGHTAGAPVQIAAGDRLGLIAIQPGVDGEGDTVRSAWQLRSEAFRDVVIYFRNSPSILIWEGGNQKLPQEKAAELRAHMDKWDPHGGRAYAHRRADQITAEFMDVGIGTEGGREIARLAVVEGEYNREESPRRVWDDASPPNFGYPEAKGQTYQLTSEQFAANQVAHYVKKLGAPEHAGGANWIFSDSTSGGRVAVEVARTSGEVDGVRLPKEAYHVVATMFRDEPGVHIIGHWTYPAGTRKDVFVVSNAEEVELLVNGRSLGTGTVSDKHLFTFRDVAWEPGEVRAIARSGGNVVAEQSKRTTGPAVALRITPITGPAGFVADGSDVALFDVEAIDADGARVPTFQARADFEFEGPAVWRGGYNSGKLDSTNNMWLDLEAGVNRVAVRATREPGTVTLRARSAGLADGEANVEAVAFKASGGWGATMPAVKPARLAATAIARVPFSSAAATAAQATGESAQMAGRFTRTFNYSGPSSYIVHVESFARAGKNAYVDVDSPLGELPPELEGADWVQAANREAFYHAVDLMELGVVDGATVLVAHDDAIARPPWLGAQFQATSGAITVLGRRMTLFARGTTGGSVTLGPNTEDASAREGNMYLVFVKGS